MGPLIIFWSVFMSEKDTRLLTICVKQQHRKGYSPMYCIVLIMYEVWQLCTLKHALAGCRNGLVMFYRDTFLLKHSLVFVRTLLSHGCTDKQEKVWMLHRADGTYLRRPLQTHTPSSFTYAEVKKKRTPFLPVSSSHHHRTGPEATPTYVPTVGANDAI